MGIDELPDISSRYWALMNYLISAVDMGIDEKPDISSSIIWTLVNYLLSSVDISIDELPELISAERIAPMNTPLGNSLEGNLC